MEIIIPAELVAMFQECLDTVDSYVDPGNPNALKQVCASIRAQLTADSALAMPSYLALSLYGAVKLKDEKRCVFYLNQGELPDWHNIQIHKSGAKIVRQMRELDDELAKNAAVVAFCLSHADKVKCEEVEIFRLQNMPITTGGEEDDQWIEG